MAKHRNHIPKLHSITSTVTSIADTIFMEKIKLRIEQWRNACMSSNPNEGSCFSSCCSFANISLENFTGILFPDALVRSLRKLLRGGDIYGSRPCLNIDVCNHRQVLLVAQVSSIIFNAGNCSSLTDHI